MLATMILFRLGSQLLILLNPAAVECGENAQIPKNLSLSLSPRDFLLFVCV
jgi:hypothetical protein